MEQNPYESPKEVQHRPKRSLLAVATATVVIGSVGCICGGITWYSVGVFGEYIAGDTFILFPGNDPVLVGTPGWFLGVPLGLLVMGFTWYSIGRRIWRRRP